MSLDPQLCPLCGSPSPRPLIEGYFHCANCDLRFMDPKLHLSPEAEKARYALHNNSFSDPRYRDFLRPLAEAVGAHIAPPATGLDYGSGTAAVLADILARMGYITAVYDPFFAPHPEVLERRYDFVCASEVAEHFFNPAKEFALLRSRLRPGGILAVMTAIYNESVDFSKWYYRKDPTHVVFYSSTTFVWIANHYGFKDPVFRGDRIVVLRDRRDPGAA